MILAGRPYHVDPEIGHGIDKLALSLGFVVVTEDSICHLAPVQHVKVLDQWTFHARLYRAAAYAAAHPDTELVQLVSFGCGVDAITTDEVQAILENAGVLHPDQDRRDHVPGRSPHPAAQPPGCAGRKELRPVHDKSYVPFTKEMIGEYTILIPDMLPMHFKLIVSVMKTYGYNMELLETTGPYIAETGLRYTHNDTCYPAILVIGQFMDALLSGRYDPHKTALIMFQTGGGAVLPTTSPDPQARPRQDDHARHFLQPGWAGKAPAPGSLLKKLHRMMYAILYGTC